jgi:hypothetical protein
LKETTMGGVEKLHKKFDIHKIERDDALQARVKLDHKVVKDYAGKMKNGTQFPPLVLFQEGEGADARYWLADGWHRLAAYEQNKKTCVPVRIIPGTYRDALLYALGANSQHGLQRSTADKQKAVETFLLDTEWQQWSNEEIARYASVDAKTVGNKRRKLEQEGTIPRITTRKSNRNGKTTTTSTDRIGRKPQSVEPATDSQQNGVKEDVEDTQANAFTGEPQSHNGSVVEVEQSPATDRYRGRGEHVQVMGDSEELFTRFQAAIANYKMEHPLLPDAFVQQAISRLWSAWAGFVGFPMVSGLCQCRTAHFASAADRAPGSMWQREHYVPLWEIGRVVGFGLSATTPYFPNIASFIRSTTLRVCDSLR